MLVLTSFIRTRPYVLRSSVAYAIPFFTALGIVLTSTSLPRIWTWPLTKWPQERPKTLIANSVRPAPIRPAIPTTSPARTLMLTSLITIWSW